MTLSQIIASAKRQLRTWPKWHQRATQVCGCAPLSVEECPDVDECPDCEGRGCYECGGNESEE